MSKATTIKDAIKRWGERNETDPAQATEVKLYFQAPPIEKMDNNLSQLANCEFLSLSTNCISAISGLSGLPKLKRLSLARNVIREFRNSLEGVADTLEELWISYNVVDKLNGLSVCKNLKVLYMSNNKIDKWSEVEKLQDLRQLEDLIMLGNPIQERLASEEPNWRVRVVKLLPQLKKLDGSPIDDAEREAAAAL